MSESLSRPLQAAPSQLDSHLSVDKECSIVERQTSLEGTHNPRRWSVTKKRLTLGIICFIAFVPDFASATGIITVIPQAKEWGVAPYAVQQTVSANIAALGICNILVIMLSNYFGRLPVVFFLQIVSVLSCAWCARATTFHQFLAARIVNGLGASAAQGGGLMWIQDIFDPAQRPRAINMLEFPIIISPYLGPLVTAFMISELSWRWPFWLCTILFTLGLLLVVFFLDETMHDRVFAGQERSYPMRRLTSLCGIQQPVVAHQLKRSFLTSALRPLTILKEPPVLLSVVYYFLNFAWVISVNTTVSIWLSEFYGFMPRNIGFFSFFGVIGVTIGWLVGHWMHDAVGLWYAKRHDGRIEPEARLIITYPATIIMTLSLIVLGFAIQNLWHYMVLAVFAAVQCGGIMITTTAVNAYLLDSYPDRAGEVSAWVSNGRIFGGFMATYIQIPWVEQHGAAVALGIQAAITGSSAMIIAFIQWRGAAMRQQSKIVA